MVSSRATFASKLTAGPTADVASPMAPVVRNFLEATSDIHSEPHQFKVTLTLAHGNHAHTYETQFTEDEHHHHLRQAHRWVNVAKLS